MPRTYLLRFTELTTDLSRVRAVDFREVDGLGVFKHPGRVLFLNQGLEIFTPGHG